jgi:hypothetical protein
MGGVFKGKLDEWVSIKECDSIIPLHESFLPDVSSKRKANQKQIKKLFKVKKREYLSFKKYAKFFYLVFEGRKAT